MNYVLKEFRFEVQLWFKQVKAFGFHVYTSLVKLQ